MTPIVLVANPNARAVEDARDFLEQAALRPDLTVVRPSSREDTIETARSAALDGARFVVAAGGDGTISAVAHGLVEARTDTALGVVPLGTGNDFARTLHIPTDPEQALALVDAPNVRALDAVRIEHVGGWRWFVNVTTAGDFARVAGQLTDEMKKKWGPLCFIRGALPGLLDPTVYDLEVALNDTAAVRERVLGAAFANARTAAGGIELAPQASSEDGRLDVVAVRDGTVADLAALAARYVAGKLLDSDLISFRRARRVLVRSNPPLPLSVDGEEIQPSTDVTFTVEPLALRAVVGAGYEPPEAD